MGMHGVLASVSLAMKIKQGIGLRWRRKRDNVCRRAEEGKKRNLLREIAKKTLKESKVKLRIFFFGEFDN